MDAESSEKPRKSGSLGMKKVLFVCWSNICNETCKAHKYGVLEEDSNFYTAFTQYNLDKI